jgi:hypothetical protein
VFILPNSQSDAAVVHKDGLTFINDQYDPVRVITACLLNLFYNKYANNIPNRTKNAKRVKREMSGLGRASERRARQSNQGIQRGSGSVVTTQKYLRECSVHADTCEIQRAVFSCMLTDCVATMNFGLGNAAFVHGDAP